MSEEETRPSVLMMEAEVPSIEAVAASLLRETQEPRFATLGSAERGHLEEEVSFFFNELATIVLNWISTVRMEEIEDLFIALEKAVAGASESRPDASVHARLSARLDTLAYLLRAVLRTENLAKYMGELSGKRRAAWGELLVNLYDEGRPVSKTDACEFVPSMRNPNTVYHALERLSEMGLLERIEQENASRVSYTLSWPGRMVARAWRDLHPDSSAESERDFSDYIINTVLGLARFPSRSSSWENDRIETVKKEISMKFVVAART